jgi:enamine deaminase RidA (YjgF/YER057c/UK114 family)
MRGQLGQALDNLETVLSEAGMDLSNLVRLNFYATDVDAFFEASDVLGSRMGEQTQAPPDRFSASPRLAFPPLMVELEATAAA